VDLTTATVEDIIHLVMMTTAVNIQIAIVRVRTGVAMIWVVPTIISVVRERVTVTMIMIVLET